MKRILLITLAVLALAFVGVVIYAARNLNPMIAELKPKIERAASDALGATVTVGAIEANAFPLPGLRIAEVSTSHGEERLSLKNLVVRLNLLALLRGVLAVSEVSLSNPEALLIKDHSGIRLAGLPPAKAKVDSPTAIPAASSEPPAQGSTSGATLPTVEINSISIQGLKVSLRDQAAGRDYALVNSLGVNLAATLSSGALGVNNLKVRGTILDTGSLNVSGSASGLGTDRSELTIRGDVKNLPHEKLAALAAVITGAPLPLELSGHADLSFVVGGSVKEPTLQTSLDLTPSVITKPGTFSKRAGHTLRADLGAALKGGKAYLSKLDLIAYTTKLTLSGVFDLPTKSGEFKAGSTTIDLATIMSGLMSGREELATSTPATLDCSAAIAPQHLALPECTVVGFKGQIVNSIELQNTALSVNSTTSTLSIGDLLSALLQGAPSPLTGTVDNVKVSLKGDTTSLPQSLHGTNTVVITKGEIVGYNLLGSVLKSVNSLPFIKGSLADNAPEEDRQSLESQNTAFDSITGTIALRDGWISTQDLTVVSSLFTFAADGKLSFAKEFDLNGTMYLSTPLSSAIVAKEKNAAGLVGADGRMVIPLALRGTYLAVVVLPNMQKLLELGAGKALQEKAGKLLGGILGGGSDKGEKRKKLGAFGF